LFSGIIWIFLWKRRNFNVGFFFCYPQAPWDKIVYNVPGHVEKGVTAHFCAISSVLKLVYLSANIG
jgi:hypothetical protein